MPAPGLRFDKPVPPGGYAWWYIDALSDDGGHGLTIIAFIGSVFSPYYGWAGHRDPMNHCCLNVALYGRPKAWAMTERGGRWVNAAEKTFVIGPSALSWDGTALTIAVDELRMPPVGRIRGKVRVEIPTLTSEAFLLDAAGQHLWWPACPSARVEVSLDKPGLSWSGSGYVDHNAGSEMLEIGFRRWDWCRAKLPHGSAILYNTEPRSGAPLTLALRIAGDGTVERVAAPPRLMLPRTFWRIERPTRADGPVKVVRTLEDAPFYSRSQLETSLMGARHVPAVHESLDMTRFERTLVKLMLPFRMPRLG